jgi:hypothetical protein
MAEESERAGEFEALYDQLSEAERKEMEALVETYKREGRGLRSDVGQSRGLDARGVALLRRRTSWSWRDALAQREIARLFNGLLADTG